MAETIPDLWPDYVTVTQVLTPLAVLRYQAGQLRQKTKNLLEAEVVSEVAGDQVNHHFDLIAPALSRYRYRLFTASHATDMAYPVVIDFSSYVEGFSETKEASTQESFFQLVGKIFNSRHTRSVIQSLLARSNELGAAVPAG